MRLFPGKRPNNLGVKNGQLKKCSSKPNCVSSQEDVSDSQHYVEPIRYQGEAGPALAHLREIIESLPRTTIVDQRDDYMHIEFETALVGFVDDLEVYLPPEGGLIHIRSASRLGYSDLGVNRKRVEMLRAKFQQ